MTTGTRKPGDFCWINLLTPHPEATQCVPFHDIEDLGRFCGLISPQGVMFYVVRYAG